MLNWAHPLVVSHSARPYVNVLKAATVIELSHTTAAFTAVSLSCMNLSSGCWAVSKYIQVGVSLWQNIASFVAFWLEVCSPHPACLTGISAHTFEVDDLLNDCCFNAKDNWIRRHTTALRWHESGHSALSTSVLIHPHVLWSTGSTFVTLFAIFVHCQTSSHDTITLHTCTVTHTHSV